MSDYSQLDQTQFYIERPLEESLTSDNRTPEQKKRALYLRWAGVGAALLVGTFILLLGVLATRRQTGQEQTTVPSPEPRVSPERGVLQSRLDEITTELELADPSRPKLIFPAVDMTISIERAR